MKLEQQVCSLEISRKLKELGVEQHSIFGWIAFNDGTADLDFRYDGNLIPPTECSAFTVAELGELIKKHNPLPKWDMRLEKWEKEFPKGLWISCDTEADARAKMLIYLLENKLISK